MAYVCMKERETMVRSAHSYIQERQSLLSKEKFDTYSNSFTEGVKQVRIA